MSFSVRRRRDSTSRPCGIRTLFFPLKMGSDGREPVLRISVRRKEGTGKALVSLYPYQSLSSTD